MTDDDAFDVAISFCARDESTAKRLHDVLLGRLSVFLYSEEQRRLAGTDGEVTFNAVYGKQALLVVVLYRAEWGETPFTRYEATAIRNRAFNAGYDFTVFIPMAPEEAQKVPPWVPKARLWLDLPRWGIDGAAVVIEERFREQGGIVHEETIDDIAARAAADLELRALRSEHLSSYAGVQMQGRAYGELCSNLLAGIEKLKEQFPAFDIKAEQSGTGGPAPAIKVLSRPVAMLLGWHLKYANEMKDTELEATLWEGHPPWPGTWTFDAPTKLKTLKMKPDLRTDGQAGWRRGSSKEEPMTSKASADEILKFFIEGQQRKTR